MILKDSYDVVVAGCGPAGSSVAMQCAKLGLDVLVLERNQEIGAPKRCGEGLSDGSVKELELKIPPRCIAQNIDGTYVYAPNGKEIEIRFENTKGYVLERKVFDKWLAFEAAKAGAKIVARADVTDLIIDRGFVKGVKASRMGENLEIKSKVVVAADGAESFVARKAGLKTGKQLTLIDTGLQYEMANIGIKDPHMIEIHLGTSIAPRGYCWLFPKGEHEANVGVGLMPQKERNAKYYLDEFIKRENLNKGSIIEVNAGCIPVGGFMKSMTGDGILAVGDAANQVNPLHGGGIKESIVAGRIAGDVIAKAVSLNDVSARGLDDYNRRWWKERGERLSRVEKVREAFEKMSDDQMNLLADVLIGSDLAAMARGDTKKLIMAMAKFKMKDLAHGLGF